MATISDGNYIHQTTIDFLQETMQATEDEIDYISKLNQLKLINTSVSTNEDLFRFPSIILDDFLYLGDLRNRRDVCLLRAWNIRNIIGIIEYKVKDEIPDEFNVMWINLQDCMSANIGQYFDQTNELIESSRSKNEKVFVHCQAGVSRSASIVLAYLLRYHHSNLNDAYVHLLKKRYLVEPNDGFLLQLIRYEQILKTKRLVSTTVS